MLAGGSSHLCDSEAWGEGGGGRGNMDLRTGSRRGGGDKPGKGSRVGGRVMIVQEKELGYRRLGVRAGRGFSVDVEGSIEGA